MQPSLDKLRKIFNLEAERQFDNGAVMGGLEKMLPGWAAEAQAEDVNEPLIAAITSQLRNYDDLLPEYRAEALKNVWNRIERETGSEMSIGQPGKHAHTEYFQIKQRPVSERAAKAAPTTHKAKLKSRPKAVVKKKRQPPKPKK